MFGSGGQQILGINKSARAKACRGAEKENGNLKRIDCVSAVRNINKRQ